MNREGDIYVKELKSIEKALKAITSEMRELRERKREIQLALYEYMEARGIERLEGYTLKQLKPKERAKRLSKKAKKQRAIELFTQIGIPNPNDFYKEFITHQSTT